MHSGREGPSESCQFQGLPWRSFEWFTFSLKELLWRIECFNLRRDCYTTLKYKILQPFCKSLELFLREPNTNPCNSLIPLLWFIKEKWNDLHTQKCLCMCLLINKITWKFVTWWVDEQIRAYAYSRTLISKYEVLMRTAVWRSFKGMPMHKVLHAVCIDWTP